MAKNPHKVHDKDSIRGQLGCVDKSFSKWSTFMGVIILKRCGFLAIISFGMGEESSDKGTLSIGSVVSVTVAEGVLLISFSDHR